MKICGIEIKGSEAIVAVVELDQDNFRHVPLETKKITLKDDEDATNIKSFLVLFNGFIRDNQIKCIAIKKRGKKGEFSGGAVTFKIEAILQLLEHCTVELLSAQTISAANRKHAFIPPDSLNKYQHEAFFSACTAISRAKK